MKISIILSFRNEERNLPELLDRLRSTLISITQYDYEIILVNDSSTDSSEAIILKRMSDFDSKLVLVNMSRNFGATECVIAGLEVSQGDLIVYMDSDLQDPPELIPQLIEAHLNTGAQIVHTVRTKRRGETRGKLFITKIGYGFLEKFYKIDVPREAGDYKLLTRRVVDLLLQHKEQLPFMRGLIANLGFKTTSVGYERDARGDGKENTKFRVFSWRWVSGHIDRTLISFTDIPLKLALFLGFGISGISLMMLFLVIVLKFAGWAIPGWAAIMFSVLLLGGAQLLVIGVLGLYINVIYLETKKRPLYVIEKIIRAENI